MSDKPNIKVNHDAVSGPKDYTDFEVQVDSNNIERAIKSLKRKLIRENFYKLVKQNKYFEKPSVVKKRKGKEAAKRIRKEQKQHLNKQF